MSATGHDLLKLRRALGTFATGVTVVTTVDESGQDWGFTANSFTSVSLEPPLVLVCLAKVAGCYPRFRDANHFAVNILADEQREISMAFASPSRDKFSGVTHSPRVTGCAVLDEAVAWLDCAMDEIIDAGDHIILIGRVLDFDSSDRAPLGYCRGAYVSFGLSQQALRATEDLDRVCVSAIIEHDSAIVLERGRTALRVPSAARLGSTELPSSLLGKLHACGVSAPSLFLFAVFDANHVHHIVYRAEAAALDAARLDAAFELVPLEQVNVDQLAETALAETLTRYIRERAQENFDVAQSDEHGAQIRVLPHTR